MNPSEALWIAATAGEAPPVALVLGVAAGTTVLMLVVMVVVLRRLLVIGQPNELLVISGRPRRLPDGRVVGYRLVRGGRVLRLPFLETVQRLSLQNIPLSVRVENAYAGDARPLALEVGANVRISTEPALVDHAVERFLAVPREELARVATDVLTGCLREAAAKLTIEEVRQDAERLVATLRAVAEPALAKLGLELDAVALRRAEPGTEGAPDAWRPQRVPGAD